MDMMELRRQIALNEPHIVTTTPAGVANFSTDMISSLKSCKVEFLPVQSGSGDPSPSNVRAISGWTGCTVWRAGKNLFNVNASFAEPSDTASSSSTKRTFSPYTYSVGLSANNYRNTSQINSYSITNGTITIDGKTMAYGIAFAMPLVQGEKYRISATGSNIRINVGFYAKDGTWLSYVNNITVLPEGKFTVPDNCYMTTIVFVTSVANTVATFSNIKLELGSTATPYEPYTGSTIPINWTTEAGTVYGGYVDLMNGEVAETWALANFNNASSWNSYGTGDAFFVYHIESSMMLTNYAAGVCDRFPTKTSASQSISTPYIRIGGGNDNGIYFYNVTQLNVTSIAEWKEYIGTTGVNVVYPLAVPITYQLTPTQLKSLRGVNNIWSDTNGNTTVKYWAH